MEEFWILGEEREECDLTCEKQGLTCGDGRWGITDREKFRLKIEEASNYSSDEGIDVSGGVPSGGAGSDSTGGGLYQGGRWPWYIVLGEDERLGERSVSPEPIAGLESRNNFCGLGDSDSAEARDGRQVDPMWQDHSIPNTDGICNSYRDLRVIAGHPGGVHHVCYNEYYWNYHLDWLDTPEDDENGILHYEVIDSDGNKNLREGAIQEGDTMIMSYREQSDADYIKEYINWNPRGPVRSMPDWNGIYASPYIDFGIGSEEDNGRCMYTPAPNISVHHQQASIGTITKCGDPFLGLPYPTSGNIYWDPEALNPHNERENTVHGSSLLVEHAKYGGISDLGAAPSSLREIDHDHPGHGETHPYAFMHSRTLAGADTNYIYEDYSEGPIKRLCKCNGKPKWCPYMDHVHNNPSDFSDLCGNLQTDSPGNNYKKNDKLHTYEHENPFFDNTDPGKIDWINSLFPRGCDSSLSVGEDGACEQRANKPTWTAYNSDAGESAFQSLQGDNKYSRWTDPGGENIDRKKSAVEQCCIGCSESICQLNNRSLWPGKENVSWENENFQGEEPTFNEIIDFCCGEVPYVPEDCIGEWSPWGECSCETSKQHRSYSVSALGDSGGIQCEEVDGTEESQDCNRDPICFLRVGIIVLLVLLFAGGLIWLRRRRGGWGNIIDLSHWRRRTSAGAGEGGVAAAGAGAGAGEGAGDGTGIVVNPLQHV